jgi:GNAT superfamily N-acetyltransferase
MRKTPADGSARKLIIRSAMPRDLGFLVNLLKRNSGALGFLPRAAILEKVLKRHVRLAVLDGMPAGYLIHGSLAREEVRVFQAAVRGDARRRHLGRALVEDLVRRATLAGARAISLRCLDDLNANAFWQSSGFRLAGKEPGRTGTLNIWGIRLRPSERCQAEQLPPFEFQSRMHPCPRCGRGTMDTWTRGGVRHRRCASCVMGR